MAKAHDEAHSDIAAVTLAGIKMTDYILFFIRNIIELDRKESVNISELYEGSLLRFTLTDNKSGPDSNEKDKPPYPEDSLSYGGHHYYIYDEEGTDWDDATGIYILLNRKQRCIKSRLQIQKLSGN